MLETCCKNCCFAQYDKANKTQIDCYIDQLKKFRKSNIEIIEAYDDEKEFYVIKKLCNNFRDSPWAIVNLQNKLNIEILGKDYKKFITDSKLIEKLKEENKFKCDLIIYLNKDSIIDDLEKIVSSAKTSTVHPIKIIVINNKAPIKPSQIEKACKDMPWAWTLEIILQDNTTKEECLSLIGRKLSGQYSIILDAGSELDSNLISNIDIYINEKMQILLLSENSLIIQNLLFKLCNCNILYMEEVCKAQSKITPLNCLQN